MWHTKSLNNVTVNHESQIRHDANAAGRITAFYDDPTFAYVNGEAGGACADNVRRYSRAILVIKSELMVVFDRLCCEGPSTFQWHLHTVNAPRIESQHSIHVENAPAAARVNFLWPNKLEINQSDAFDPPLMAGHDLVQHHLTAHTPGAARAVNFITVFQLHRSEDTPVGPTSLHHDGNVFIVAAPLNDNRRLEVILDPEEARTAVIARILTEDATTQARFDADVAIIER